MHIEAKDFERYLDRMIDVQRRLVAIPALGPDNGGDGEYLKSREMIKILGEFGLNDIQEYDCPDERVSKKVRPNLAAIVTGKDRNKTLWVLSHLDVVPVGERSLWHGDPFELKVEADCLVGRGVEDNHIGIIMSLFGIQYLKEKNISPFCNIGLLFVADEETASQQVLLYLLKDKKNPFRKTDNIVVPDSGNEEGTAIEVAEKSILLRVLDTSWKDHLHNLDHLRQGINLRAIAQRDPLNEYKQEAFTMFEDMMTQVCETTVSLLSHLEIGVENEDELEQAALEGTETDQNALNYSGPAKTLEDTSKSGSGAKSIVQRLAKSNPSRGKKAADTKSDGSEGSDAEVSRNAQCPCGSGERYKHCCGKK